jgi:glycosyltransferase involved in cell wall biosynthesis
MKKTSRSLVTPKIALVYDRVNTPYGGAENVLLALHEVFPEAPLYTSVYSAARAPWARAFTIHTSFLQHIPFASSFHRAFVPLMPLAFESLDLSEYDIVISVTSAEAKGVLTKPHQLHICYLLTPTRYLWSHAEEYEKHWLTGEFRTMVFDYLRWWDGAAALRPDLFIPISRLVADRCREFYHRPTAPVIYPTVGEVPQNHQATLPTSIPKHFYLIVSRLVSYKRIDLAIKTCQKLHKNLVIIGQGPDLDRLQETAKGGQSLENAAQILFLHAVQPDQLAAYYQRCVAFLAPAEEDFGMTVIEAQRVGKPVIVYQKSGGAEVVKEGVAGIHFAAQTQSDLSEAIHILESRTWDPGTITKNAVQYSQSRFQDAIKKAVEDAWLEFSRRPENHEKGKI